MEGETAEGQGPSQAVVPVEAAEAAGLEVEAFSDGRDGIVMGKQLWQALEIS